MEPIEDQTKSLKMRVKVILQHCDSVRTKLAGSEANIHVEDA